MDLLVPTDLDVLGDHVAINMLTRPLAEVCGEKGKLCCMSGYSEYEESPYTWKHA